MPESRALPESLRLLLQSIPFDVLVICWPSFSSECSAWFIAWTASFSHWMSLLLSFLDGVTEISQGSKLLGWMEGTKNTLCILFLFSLTSWFRLHDFKKIHSNNQMWLHHPTPNFCAQVQTYWCSLSSLSSSRKKKETPCVSTGQYPSISPTTSLFQPLVPLTSLKFPDYPDYFKGITLYSKSDWVKIKTLSCHLNLSNS